MLAVSRTPSLQLEMQAADAPWWTKSETKRWILISSLNEFKRLMHKHKKFIKIALILVKNEKEMS